MSSSDSDDREKGTGSSSEEEEYWPYWKLAIIGIPQMGVMVLWIFLGPNTTPYLKSLGASESFATLNNSAGPIVGFIVGPIVGSWSDQSTSKWGRRRPIIVAGLLATMVAGLLYAGAEQLMGKGNNAMYLAAGMQWVLDFTINAMQTPFRALVADLSNKEQQFPMQIFFGVICSIGVFLAFTIMGLFPIAIHHMLECMCYVLLINCVCVALLLLITKEKQFVPVGKAKKSSACGFITGMGSACKGMPCPKFGILLFVQAMVWLGNTVWGSYGKEWFTDSVFLGDSEAPMDSEARNMYIEGAAAFGFAGQMGSFFNLAIALGIMALGFTSVPHHLIYAPCICIGAFVCFLCAFVVGQSHSLATLAFVLSNVCLSAAGSIPCGIVAVWNKAAEEAGHVGSIAMQMAVLNCMITVGQQLCTMILAGLEVSLDFHTSIHYLFVISMVANGLASVGSLFLSSGKGKEVADTLGSESDNTSDAD